MNFIDLIPFDLDIGWNCQTILNKFIATLTAIENHLCALHSDLIIHFFFFFFFFSASTRLGLVRLNEKWILFIIWIFLVSFPGTKKNLNALKGTQSKNFSHNLKYLKKIHIFFVYQYRLIPSVFAEMMNFVEKSTKIPKKLNKGPMYSVCSFHSFPKSCWNIHWIFGLGKVIITHIHNVTVTVTVTVMRYTNKKFSNVMNILCSNIEYLSIKQRTLHWKWGFVLVVCRFRAKIECKQWTASDFQFSFHAIQLTALR